MEDKGENGMLVSEQPQLLAGGFEQVACRADAAADGAKGRVAEVNFSCRIRGVNRPNLSNKAGISCVVIA